MIVIKTIIVDNGSDETNARVAGEVECYTPKGKPDPTTAEWEYSQVILQAIIKVMKTPTEGHETTIIELEHNNPPCAQEGGRSE